MCANKLLLDNNTDIDTDDAQAHIELLKVVQFRVGGYAQFKLFATVLLDVTLPFFWMWVHSRTDEVHDKTHYVKHHKVFRSEVYQ